MTIRDRIVMVNHRYWPFVGGSEAWIQRVAEALARAHDVDVITADAFDLEYFWDRNRERVAAPRRESVNDVNVTRVPIRHVPASSVVFRGTRRLMGEASRVPIPASVFAAIARVQPLMPSLSQTLLGGPRPIAFHATNLGLEGLALHVADAARARNVPYILTPFIHLGVEGDRTARRYVSMPHQRHLLRNAAAILTMTETEASFVRSCGVDRSRVFVTGAGVDIASVTGGNGASFRVRHGINGPIVAALGAMAEDKGTFSLVDAAIDLRRRGLNANLVLAGPRLSAFERWMSSLSVDDRHGIHVLGYITENERRDLLDAADVIALPSRTESFGIVYLEGWANRKPVVAADTPATRELIADGESGYIIPFGDVGRLSDALSTLVADADLRTAMGQRGHQLVTANFTWNHVVERVMIAYSQVVGSDVTAGGA